MLNTKELTKKVLIWLPGALFVAAVAVGVVVFDRNSQDRKMRVIESRLKSIKAGIRNGSEKTSQDQALLSSTETELNELADRWVADRKQQARRRIAHLTWVVKAKGSRQPTPEEIKSLAEQPGDNNDL